MRRPSGRGLGVVGLALLLVAVGTTARRTWPIRNDNAACHFLRRARPLADLVDTRRLRLAHRGLAAAYRRLNCALYTAVYPGDVLNGHVLAHVPVNGNPAQFRSEAEEADFCLSLLSESWGG